MAHGRKKPASLAAPPATIDLARLKKAARACQACPLYKNATQTVFGAGPRTAALMIVGEQPGDKEDRGGEPFIGPSGHLLDQVLEELGVERTRIYVTNAVKHFKWQAVGRQRLHQRPTVSEVRACHPWLHAELASVKPAVVLCMGATAAMSVLGRALAIGASRGQLLAHPELALMVAVTWHPSAILRSPTAEAREVKKKEFKEDFQFTWQKAQDLKKPKALERPEPLAQADSIY